jgi:type IV secretion system protein VirB4
MYVVMLYEGGASTSPFHTAKGKRLYANKLRRQAEYLRINAMAFHEAVDDMLHPQLLEKRAIFDFFRLLANPDPNGSGAETLCYDNNVDYWMSSAVPLCGKDGMVIDREHVDVLVLRKTPKLTHPMLLREFLRLEANYILCSEYKHVSNEKAIKEINSAQNHFHVMKTLKNIPSLLLMACSRGKKDDIVPDESAVEAVKELSEMVVRINTHGEAMGHYSLTLLLHSQDKAKLQAASAKARRIVGNQEGSLLPESYNALNPYLAMVPGGAEFNKRYLWLLSKNYADLSLVYAPYLGNRINPHLKQEHLLLLTTRDKTPVFFNLHEDDLLGFFALGIMGSGKSFTTNLFVDCSQKYQPFTFIIHIGGSYRHVVERHGGSYVKLQLADNQFTINPFAVPRTPENRQFLYSFVRVLLTSSGQKLSPKDDRQVFEAVKDATRLGDLQLSDHLMDCLYPWVGDHQYGSLFDNERDTLGIADCQAFDFQGMEVFPQVVEPLMFYLFQRISQIVYDPRNLTRFKQLICDEAWKFFENPTARNYLQAAGLTWRKHNGGIGLITQFLESLESVGMLELVNAICPTKILLANPGANLKRYAEVFKLNPNETLLFSQLRPKREILVKTPTRCQVLTVEVDAESAIRYGNDPYGNDKRNKMIAEHGEEEGLRRLAAG